jgi:hypothetical protein
MYLTTSNQTRTMDVQTEIYQMVANQIHQHAESIPTVTAAHVLVLRM